MVQTQQETSNNLSLYDISSKIPFSLITDLSSKILGANWQDVPIMQAIVNNNKEVWSTILGIYDDTTLNPIELVKKDINGNTGLHAAGLLGNTEVVNAYAKAGLVHNDKNNFGLIPLHNAIIRGDHESVGILLNHNASAIMPLQLHFPLINASITVSALTLAVLLGHVEVVNVIYTELQKQHKLNNNVLAVCPELGTILHIAVVSCYANILEFLLTTPMLRDWSKQFIEMTNKDGKTPLAYAAEAGNLDAIQWLVNAGANVSGHNNVYGRTPLHYAVLGKQPFAIYLLLQLNANALLESQEPVSDKPGETKSRTPIKLAEKLKSKANLDPYLNVIYQMLSSQTQVKAESQDLGIPGQIIHRTLVIQGGGVKGLAYAGALLVLEQKGVIKGLHRAAGTSAGAITALLVALNFSSDAIEKALMGLSVKNMLGNSGQQMTDAKVAIKTWLDDVEKNFNDASYLKKGKGVAKAAWRALSNIPEFFTFFKILGELPFKIAVSDGKALENWLKALIASKLKQDLIKLNWDHSKISLYIENFTFSRLRDLVSLGSQLGYKHLYTSH